MRYEQTHTQFHMHACLSLSHGLIHSSQVSWNFPEAWDVFMLCLAMQEFIEPFTAVKQYSLQMITINLADWMNDMHLNLTCMLSGFYNNLIIMLVFVSL